MNSQPMILFGAVLKNSPLRALDPPRSSSRDLWRLWDALGDLWEVLGELWQGLGELRDSPERLNMVSTPLDSLPGFRGGQKIVKNTIFRIAREYVSCIGALK